jgi:hypothetical protein
MTTYRTMTISGIYGGDIEADTDEQAIAIAQGPGRHDVVLDVTDVHGKPCLVLAE